MFLPIFSTPIAGQPPEPVSVIYPSDTVEWNIVTLDQIVDRLTNRRLPPSRILIICPFGRHEPLLRALNDEEQRLRERLRATGHVAVAPYDNRGQIREADVADLWHEGEPWAVTDHVVVDLARRYIDELTKQTNAILEAPSGYQFRKPSGNASTIFIRAGNMLREQDSLNVFSHMLLREWPPEGKAIYVDSFTVLSFAMALQRTVAFFRSSEKDSQTEYPAIENFHSYKKESSFYFPENGRYLVVTSASTSGQLATKLVDEHNADRRKIVHLLGAGDERVDDRFRQSCICYRELPLANQPAALADIAIGGEEFIPSYGEPRTVSLTKQHIDSRHAQLYKAPFYLKHLRVRSSATLSGYGSYSLFSVSNKNNTLGPEEFDRWLRERLVHEIPASIALIVHLEDAMSEALAHRVAGIFKRSGAVDVISVANVTEHETDLKKCDSVLIVASEDPNLEGFVRAGTVLRRWPDAFRHYILGHAFPETKSGFDGVAGSLTVRSGSLPRYGWSEFAVAAVGRSDLHTSALFNYPVDFNSIQTEIKQNLTQVFAEYSNPDSRQLFLPKLDGSRLALRSGSVFFEGEYENVSDEVVYLAVATAVQSAREGRGTSTPRLRFDSNPFVGSVIDPQMFSRFSDGILQGALLRCLQKEELDFSKSTVLSRQARELFVSAIRNAKNVVGEAALEFMAAFAIGKISFSKEDEKVVLQALEDGTDDLPDLLEVWRMFTATGPF